MPAFKLFVKLAAYYVVLGVVIYVTLRLFPGVKDYLPVGGVEALISQPDANPLEGGARAATASAVGSMSESLFWLSAAIVGALMCSLPVSWTYMSIRTGEEYDQSLISTIMVLPLVVTGIVIIVQNSLALAFALAGIAGAVRFKNSLKSSGDALFILVSVGIAFLLLWSTEYGEREGMKRYMADLDAPPEGEAAITSPGIPGQE
jgi:hypothetical protein